MRRLGALCYVLALVSALAALTGVIVGPDWIERLSGWSPDSGSGALESATVVLPALTALFLALFGRGLRGRNAIAKRGSS
jgi:hypothetical protein